MGKQYYTDLNTLNKYIYYYYLLLLINFRFYLIGKWIYISSTPPIQRNEGKIIIMLGTEVFNQIGVCNI